jgi:tetratricopeptide (TPR) repeat protein
MDFFAIALWTQLACAGAHTPEVTQRALAYEAAGYLQAAETCWQAALQLAQPGADEVTALLGLGRARRQQGRFSEAETVFERAMLVSGAAGGELAIPARNHIAALYRDTGRPAQAEPLLRAAIALAGGEAAAHPVLLNNLALVLADLGDETRAEPLLNKAVARFRSQYGDGYPETARALANLASLYQNSGRLAQAESLLSGLQPVWNDPRTEPSLRLHGWNQWASLLIARGKLETASDAMQAAAAIARDWPAHDPAEDLQALVNHASLCAVRKQWREARAFLQQALDRAEALYGNDNPLTAPLLAGQARILRELGDRREARELESRRRAILSLHR